MKTFRVVLIGCGKTKRETASPACELYTVCLFKARRAHAEATGHMWFVISGKHRLVEPSTMLEPYDYKLQGSYGQPKEWGRAVLKQLAADLAARGLSIHNAEIEIHAGADYVRGLREAAPSGNDAPRRFLWPVESMGVGQQLAFYKAHSGEFIDPPAPDLPPFVPPAITTLADLLDYVPARLAQHPAVVHAESAELLLAAARKEAAELAGNDAQIGAFFALERFIDRCEQFLITMNNPLTILAGDCRETLKTIPSGSVHCCVTDPPYHLTTGKKGGSGPASVNLTSPAGRARITTGFMGMEWDGGAIAFDSEFWREVLRVLKPGGHLLSFGATRTQHRMVCAIEDAGFEIRDQLAWVYGSGFPKSLDVSKAIDKAAGVERAVISQGEPLKRMIPGADQNATGSWVKDNGREYVPTVTAPATDEAKQWEGWGTALKPAWEPICLARKPFAGTVAANVVAHGAGALNVEACREDGVVSTNPAVRNAKGFQSDGLTQGPTGTDRETLGRWPANLMHDGSEEVIAAFPDAPGQQRDTGPEFDRKADVYGKFAGVSAHSARGDIGSAARFFYCAKAGAGERNDSKHPTVKPLALIRYLVRLVCAPGGTVLDPFAGSGTTGEAALPEGFKVILCEQNPEYLRDIERRCTVTIGLGL